MAKIEMIMYSFVIGILAFIACASYVAISRRNFHTATGFDKMRYDTAIDYSRLIGAIVGLLALIFFYSFCNPTP